jgi:peptidoglycan-associated lipoprotein
MTNFKPIMRSLYVPAVFLLGACCCNKEAVLTPVPPPLAPVTAPVQSAIVAPMDDVYFAFDRSDLSPNAQSQLRANASWMSSNSDAKVVLEGNCDERGTTEYNMALGERRAISAKEYMVSIGVNPDRMSTISYGEERPLDPGHNETAWAKNRRVHFRVK